MNIWYEYVFVNYIKMFYFFCVFWVWLVEDMIFEMREWYRLDIYKCYFWWVGDFKSLEEGEVKLKRYGIWWDGRRKRGEEYFICFLVS